MGNGSGVSMNRGGSTTFGASDSNIKSEIAKGVRSTVNDPATRPEEEEGESPGAGL